MKIRNLRTKLVLSSLPILLVGGLAYYMISSFLIIPGFQKIENDSSIEAANRAVDAINNRVSQLNLKASDWANWDDTYDFMKDHNKKYISSNLQNQTLANLGIDYMMFFDTNKKMLDMKHVNIRFTRSTVFTA